MELCEHGIDLLTERGKFTFGEFLSLVCAWLARQSNLADVFGNLARDALVFRSEVAAAEQRHSLETLSDF